MADMMMRVETSSGHVVEADVRAFVSALIQVLSNADLSEVLRVTQENQEHYDAITRPPLIIH